MCIFSLFGGGGSSSTPTVLNNNTEVAEAEKTASSLSDKKETTNKTLSSLKVPIKTSTSSLGGTDTGIGLNIPT